MKNKGFVIASSSKHRSFFTSSSAFDKAQWLPLQEATVYYSADKAENAVKHLHKYGHFGASVVPLQEFDLDSEPSVDMQSNKGEMQAHHHGDVCPKCDHEPCTCPTVEDPDIFADSDDIIDFDKELDFEEKPLDDLDFENNSDEEFDDEFEDEVEPINGPFAVGMQQNELEPMTIPGAKKKLGESTIPVISYDDSVNVDNNVDIAGNHEDKIKVPAAIVADLSKMVDQYTQLADQYKDSTEDGSFYLTCAVAYEQLLDFLQSGTVESIKRAQIAMSSYMNPILSKIPANVQNYIYTGGKKPTLQQFYQDIKNKNKGS